VAEPVVLASWQDEPVTLGQVMDTMTRLRHERTIRASTVTSVMTLVIMAVDDADEAKANAAIGVLGGHHPARIVIVRPDPDGPDCIAARVAIWGADDVDSAAARRTTVDVICLTARGCAASHLRSVIEPFTLADVPIVVWYPGHLPDPSSVAPGVASATIVDSKEAGAHEDLSVIAGLVRDGRTVIDLSWTRLTAWRELLAGLFDGPDFRGLLGHVRSVRVQGKPGPRHLLAGWLVSRLGLDPGLVSLEDSVHAGIVLTANQDGTEGTVSVSRAGGARLVRGSAAIERGPARSTVVSLPNDNLGWSLAYALTHPVRDQVWEQALQAALAL
jgi:glucose-6-phosphate dehydrogenase assembly protein OpcA